MPTLLLISPYWKEPHRWMVSTVKLAELWQRIGYRVVVVCMGRGDGACQADAQLRSNESIERVSETLTIYRKRDLFLPDPWNYGIAFGFTGFVRRVITRETPDLIICNKVLFWSSISLIALRRTGRPVILLTDALVGMTWWPRSKFAQVCAALYAWTLGWLILRSASRIVFFHPQPASLLDRLGIAAKSQVIPTGIDPVPYAHQRQSRETVTVTYVGRLESVKGADDFLAALAPLTAEYPPLRVRVAGFLAPGSDIQSRYPTVEFLGLRHDIPVVLKESDIFVLPSFSEGLSNALMEAMAAGCAVIATEVGGNVSLIQNGVSGFLFAPGDRSALRSHVIRLLNDPSKRIAMGEAARKRIEEQFAWKIVGERYGELFAQVQAS